MSTLSTSPCSTQSMTTSNTCTTNIASRKRKRTEKTVRFDVEHTVIIDTYSRLDYDRGSTFTFPTIQYKVNPNILANTPKGPSLSLDIPSSPCDSEASSPDLEQPLILPAIAIINKKKRPKLTINTNICSGEGPLFFTKLSTNHAKHNNEVDAINDILVPVTP